MTLALKDMQAVKVNDGAGADAIGTVRIRDAAGLKTVWTASVPLAVSVDNLGPYGARAVNSTVTVTTPVVNLTITGGNPPYSVAWSRVDSGSPAWTVTAPTGLATAFSVSVAAGTTETAEFKATITDDSAATVDTATLFAIADNFGGYL